MIRKLPSFLIGAAALAIGVAVHAQQTAIAPPKVAYTTEQAAIPFDLFRGQRIFFDGTVNGVATDMMLDSGAGMTVMDAAFAKRLGLKGTQTVDVQGSAGQVPGEIAAGVDLKVGALHLANLNVLIIDLSPVERAIGRKIPVVLGREAFKAGAVTIDFPRRTIRFSDAKAVRPPANSIRLELGERDALPIVRLSVAGLPPIDAYFDLGNGGTVLLAKKYWAAQPAIASLKSAQSQAGGVGGVKPARRVTLPAVEFAGTRFTNVPAVLNEDPASLPTEGGNLGLEMLKSFVVTIDTAGKAMYLVPTAERAPLERERAGVRTELAGDRLKVAFVSADGPAAAAGLKAGDEIVAIDGRKVDAAYYAQPEWTRLPAGRAVTLDRADGSRVTVTLADYY